MILKDEICKIPDFLKFPLVKNIYIEITTDSLVLLPFIEHFPWSIP